jgi:general secretion pathway protein F
LVVAIQRDGEGFDWRALVGLPPKSPGLPEVEFLTSELALLLENGVRIDRAVAILERSGKGKAMASLLGSLAGELKQGKQLSQALQGFPEVFDRLYVNLVALGEAGGRLPEIFRGLADDLRFQRDLRQKIISAVTYPIVIAAVCVAAILFIFNFVVPNLASLFADADDLPWYTRMLLTSSAFMQRWQFVVFIAIALILMWGWRSRKSEQLIRFFDAVLLDWPLLSSATLMVERIRFSSGLSLMLEAGLPVDRALTLAAGNVRHTSLRSEIVAAVEKVKRGEQVSRALRQTRIFPDYFASLLEVGEESGALGRVFSEIARRSRDDFSNWALRITTLLEPLLILVMGLIVGGVVVVMMLSITSVTEVGL